MDEAQAQARARLQGIGLVVAAFATFSGLDAAAKYLTAYHAVPQVVAARFAFALIFALVLFLPGRGTRLFRTARPGVQLLRGLLLMTATALNFVALQYLQLAETGSILFAAPLFMCALSVPLLGERVGPRRWAAVLVGFLGVLIVMRPGTGALHWASFLSLGAALSVALFQLLTRRLARHDRAETTLLYSTLVGALLTVPAAPFVWTAPDALGWAAMLAMGFFGAYGHYILVRAYHLAPAPTLAPFSYSQIVWMVAIGFALFGDLPDLWTLVGGSVVVASGLYLLHRERVRRVG